MEKIVKFVFVFFVFFGFFTSNIVLHEVTHIVHYGLVTGNFGFKQACFIGVNNDGDNVLKTKGGWIVFKYDKQFYDSKPELIAYSANFIYIVSLILLIVKKG